MLPRVFGWFVVACAAVLATAGGAEASPITISYSFLYNNASIASGSFTFDSSLDGSVLNEGDLSAFAFNSPSGSSYGLGIFADTGTHNFEFDTATDSFLFGTVNGNGSPLTAFYSFFLTTGFKVTNGQINESLLGVPFGSVSWQTVTTTRTADAAPVPEPGTLLLLGAGIASFAARRRLERRA